MFEPPSKETRSPAYVPPQPVQPSAYPPFLAVPKKRRVWPWLAVGVLLFVAGGLGLGAWISANEKPAAVAAAASPTPTISEEMRIECVNVTRAYRAWNNDRVPNILRKVDELNEFTITWAIDDGKTFANATSGYRDQPAKRLALAVAMYNAALTYLNLALTIPMKIEQADKNKVVDTVAEIHAAFREFERQCPAG